MTVTLDTLAAAAQRVVVADAVRVLRQTVLLGASTHAVFLVALGDPKAAAVLDALTGLVGPVATGWLLAGGLWACTGLVALRRGYLVALRNALAGH